MIYSPFTHPFFSSTHSLYSIRIKFDHQLPWLLHLSSIVSSLLPRRFLASVTSASPRMRKDVSYSTQVAKAKVTTNKKDLAKEVKKIKNVLCHFLEFKFKNSDLYKDQDWLEHLVIW